MQKMYYINQSKEWLEGLPIGNGRLAAMVWGNDETDILTLNHEWLWRGINKNRKVPPNAGHIEYVRSLLKERNFFKATLATNLYFSGEGGMSYTKNSVDPYQVAGALEFTLKDCVGFEWRELDIENGIATVSRKSSKGSVISEFFTSCKNNLLMSKWYSDDSFSGTLALSRVKDDEAIYNFTVKDNKIVFNCEFKDGIKHRIITEIQTDGCYTASVEGINIENATYIECVTNIATSVFNLEAEIEKYSTSPMDCTVEKREHAAKFSKIMNGIKLELDEDESLNRLSVGERLNRIREGRRDNGITTLYFNFGRYLMMSSSINGDLPANLQGKWNDSINPPWECDYHFDINLQMNYWMSEPCNMPDCAEALLKYTESFYASGQEAAEMLYGCRGIYLPLQTDAWGISTSESFGWSAWIGAAPWIAQHFWQHYLYSGDIEFLRSRGYKFFKAVAEFYEDYLVEDENGVMQIMPSQSPENPFVEACGGSNMPVGICISSSMDVQLAYDALGYAVQAANILEVDEEMAKHWKRLQRKLPDFKIGANGRLLEWNEEFKEKEPGHRHLSHLYGVYPSDLFTAETRPEKYEAARKSLEFRLEHGGGHTGWSRAWVACLQARFGNAEAFYEHFVALIRDFASETMLDLHPPRIFQIDGNLGAVAALLEAVISFTDGKVHLLRSLPEEWSCGRLEGIKVPGGHIINVRWKDRRIEKLDITFGFGKKVIVSNVNGEEMAFSGEEGQKICYPILNEEGDANGILV